VGGGFTGLWTALRAAERDPAARILLIEGGAASSNNQPAGLLILVTSGGWPVTDLNQDHFTVMQHFDTPGNTFSNNIVSFRNAGSGAYLIQVRPNGGAVWRSGHLLGQLLVSSPDDRQGQAAFKLIIR
ncbi:MAG TPA: FAD-dependent oxidoreductase, partial [Prosthecobacter sp.]|nr:FAD-dependent oxidoreductase [Prosthecobacter sp.]